MERTTNQTNRKQDFKPCKQNPLGVHSKGTSKSLRHRVICVEAGNLNDGTPTDNQPLLDLRGMDEAGSRMEVQVSVIQITEEEILAFIEVATEPATEIPDPASNEGDEPTTRIN
ncbi:unnamed protein product [Ilex paraguariensis]|uniref:Uncharacterized protein n=1 Tax=Ilex paraguariensis TaxID=185542 RepID=A0ABC8SJY6_9AQUA